MEEKQFYRQLVERYVNKQLSPDELEVFYHLLGEGRLDEIMLESMEETLVAAPVKPVRKSGRILTMTAAAASILLLLGVAFYWFMRPQQASLHTFSQVAAIKQGPEKAILVLPSGDTVNLSGTQQGQLTSLAGVQVLKDEDGAIRYVPAKDVSTANSQALNTMKVPKGNAYQLVLEDGTRVWLNASSSLSFPLAFTEKERKVQLTGEAYFEVVPAMKAGNRPFVVESGAQKIEVLGTSFNINAYQDETVMKTTLVEGKVRVTTPGGSTLLKPGQQARINAEGGATVVSVDPETVLDWKNGDFVFVDEDLHSVMRKLSRWYNVEVVYAEGLTAETFSGRISRSKKLEEVLRLLSLSADLNYQLNNDKLYLSVRKK